VNDVATRRQRGNRTCVRGVPAGEEQCRLGSLEPRERRLELLVQFVRTRDEACGGGAGAFAVERRRDRGGDSRIAGETEVVVRRKVDGGSSVGGHSSTATRAHRMRLTPEIR